MEKEAQSVEALVFVHKGKIPSYLYCSLYQAGISSPALPIWLLGDQDPNIPFVDFVPLTSLESSWREMEKAYIHLSTNGEDFERFCFYRWFAIAEEMRRRGVERVIHLDSDVMLYFDPVSNPIDTRACLIAYGSTSSYSGHFAWIESREALLKICHTMVDLFTDPDHLLELREHFSKQGPLGGGVCDMYALGWVAWHRVLAIHELNSLESTEAFDQGIWDSRAAGKVERWKMENGLKKITWRDRQAFFETLDGQPVHAMTIHFQGDAKHLMKKHMTEQPMDFRIRFGKSTFSEQIQRTLVKLGVFCRHCVGGVRKRLELNS